MYRPIPIFDRIVTSSMHPTIKYFIFGLLAAFISVPVIAQAENGSRQRSLEEFENIASAQRRFEYFFDRQAGYGRSFEGDWKRLLSAEYQQARNVGDTLASIYYGAILSRVLLDKGEVLGALPLGERIYSMADGVDEITAPLLHTLFVGYREVGRIQEQIRILGLQKKKGLALSAQPYEIYEDAGDYRMARNAFASTYSEQRKKELDTLEKVFYLNKLGWYRIKQEKTLETALKNLVAADSLLSGYERSRQRRTEREKKEAKSLRALNTAYQGWCQLLMDNDRTGVPLIREGIRAIETGGYSDLEGEKVEIVQVVSDYLLSNRYYVQLGRYLRSIAGQGDLRQQARTQELFSAYYYQRENYTRAHQYAQRALELNRTIRANQQELINYRGLESLTAVSTTEPVVESVDTAVANDLGKKTEDDRILGLTLTLLLVLIGFIGLVFAYVKSVKNGQTILDQKKYIEKSLREKESLLKEIHHRVRNNLQMVSSLLSLQTKNTRDKAAVTALEEGKSRVKAMALIHQKLYQNDNLSSVGMQEYIESLVKSIQQVYKRSDGEIDVRIDARGTELDIDQAIPVGLILNELVSNSFKHAFPYPIENASIQIQVKSKNGQGYFEYSDNGVGLPEDSEHKSKASMGIRLVNRLVNQLQSQMNTDNSRGGVRFWFTF